MRINQQDELTHALKVLEHHAKNRGIYARDRYQEAQQDPTQLRIKQGSNLRVTSSDVNGSTVVTGDIGKFWFVPGYSEVGGPDVVRP
jgi:hypothetical protein